MILLTTIVLVVFLFRNMALFLTVNEPVGAEYLVIEGWLDKAELDQGLAYFAAHKFVKAVIVGGPISNFFDGTDTNYAERAAGYLQQRGLAEEQTVIVRVPYSAQERTFLNAVMVREWFKQQAIRLTRLDVFSSGVHTRRSRDLYRLAFGEQVAIGIVDAQPHGFDPAYWWRSSDSGKSVAIEFTGWFLVKCCFSPGAPGSHLEKWGVDKTGNSSN